MTTLIIKHKVIQYDREVLCRHLQERGINLVDFDFINWIKKWLNNPAGGFWGRKVVAPRGGDVFVAKVDPSAQEGEQFVAKGRIPDNTCVVRGAAAFDGKVKVRVVSVTGHRVECEVVDKSVAATQDVKFRCKVHYSASGVTGSLEKVPWRNDIAYLTEIVPNEILPANVLASFERVPLSAEVDRTFDVYPEAVGFEDDSGYVPVVECDNCDGDGEVTCSKCGGSGRYEPTCNVCGGTGETTCRKCGGSGSWTNGGTCYSCNGSGEHECGVCHGEGHLDFECKACSGAGEQECRVCGGTGVRRVKIERGTGKLSVAGKDRERISVSPGDVFLWRENDDDRVEPSGTWDLIERAVRAFVNRRETASRRAARLKEDFEKILKGLDEKILHEDTAGLPPVHAVLYGASPRRKRGKVIYLLKERGESAWRKSHNEPYPQGTSLKIEGVDTPQDSTICYEGYDPSRRTLEVSFPQEMDVSQLRDRELEIRSAEMRPPELRQREYLQRWMGDFGSPVCQAMIRGCTAKPVRGLELFNGNIAKYERQRVAVENGVSDVPLFLLKGPPGTGKTTIIIEIIRQAIHRGQRVLLTSQTHQAVENVLEKLHALVEGGEDKAIRMVHYTAQEGKASELANLYSDGSGTAEIKKLCKYVAECLARNGKRMASLCDPQFLSSLKDQCDEGALGAKRLSGARAAKRADREALERERVQALEKIDDETALRLAEVDGSVGREIRLNESLLSAKEKALAAANASVDGCEQVVAAKQARIKELAAGSLKSKVLSKLSFVLKDYDMSVVRKQLEEAYARKRNAVLIRDGLADEIPGIRRAIEAGRFSCAEKKSAIERAAAELRIAESAKSDARRDSRLAEHDRAIAEARDSYLRQIEDVNRFLGGEAGLSEGSVGADWAETYRRAVQEGERLKKVQDFVSDWDKTLTDKPEAVAKFLNSTTNVFMATCVGVGGWRSLMDGTYDRRFEDVDGGRPDRFFDLVIVDEAGHATCAETIIPLSMGKRAILIGDDKQLPPMEDDDLETESLFSKLWEDRGCDVPRVMLDTQFRMHPDIADFVSDTFYNGELKNGVTASDRAFQFSSFNRPVCLLSTSNQKNRYEKWKNPSYENALEAEYVREILDALIVHCNEHGAKDETVSVAVITPYAEQVSLIRQRVKHLVGASGNVKFSEDDIASVDKFQGGERDIVIASFVRSPDPKSRRPAASMTFVQDLKRMNVAFSRPKRMLILVGDIVALSRGLGNDDGRRAFEAFHRVVRSSGLEVLAWERKVS